MKKHESLKVQKKYWSAGRKLLL